MRNSFGRLLISASIIALSFAVARVSAQQLTPPNLPLAIGMTPDEAAVALGTDLLYVRGRPGDELLTAVPNVKGATLASRSDALYLQFRHGHLSAWKGDWGTIRP